MRAGPGETGGTILEAFKPGTAPPDNYSIIGVADADNSGYVSGGYGGGGYGGGGYGRPPVPQGAAPDAGSIMRPGTGGLY